MIKQGSYRGVVFSITCVFDRYDYEMPLDMSKIRSFRIIKL